jgi:exopolysaccharide biosynthesis protein
MRFVRKLPVSLVLLLLLAVPAFADWTRVARGIDYGHRVGNGWDVHITRIDLRDRSLRVIATNKSENGMTVSDFAKKNHAIVAINGDYFNEGTLTPIGTAISSCGRWWEGEPKIQRKQGLVGVGRRRAEIQERTQIAKKWMTGAVSGWPLLVRDCAVIEKLPGSDFFTRAPHPRTAVGLSKDGRTMFFVVADGRSENVGGPTLPELAQFMRELGACTAMNLDGGGSSAMWLEDRIVSRPSDGKERNVGNHLAVVSSKDYKGCTR